MVIGQQVNLFEQGQEHILIDELTWWRVGLDHWVMGKEISQISNSLTFGV